MKIARAKTCDARNAPEDAVVFKAELVKSVEEIELAYLLAERSFKNKTNIANKFKYEFLLWLTGKTDIKSAMAMSASNAEECIVVFFGEKSACEKELPLNLKKTAEPLDIEKISLSRVKN